MELRLAVQQDPQIPIVVLPQRRPHLQLKYVLQLNSPTMFYNIITLLR